MWKEDGAPNRRSECGPDHHRWQDFENASANRVEALACPARGNGYRRASCPSLSLNHHGSIRTYHAAWPQRRFRLYCGWVTTRSLQLARLALRYELVVPARSA